MIRTARSWCGPIRAPRGFAVVGFAGFSMLARGPGCGDVDSSSTGSVNAPCERTNDCADGLACEDGVCTGPDFDAGEEAGAKDSGGDG